MEPYPLRTRPFFRDYLWGGRKLADVLGKEIPADGIWAESWEMIDHPEHQSQIINGDLAGHTLHEVASATPQWLFGEADCNRTSLPLLLKYLDCQRVLSVQVHPNDEYGATMTPPDLGKTEAWFIVDAEPGAKLYAGLKEGVTAADLRAAINDGTLEQTLHVIEPSPGDCIFIPAGTVHALGEGLLVAEIQQASNTTFRLFDWNRVDADGNPRDLHVEQALEVIDFDSGPRSPQTPEATEVDGRTRLVECDKFVLDRLEGGSIQVAGDDRFHLLTAPYGNVVLQGSPDAEALRLDVGQSILLPASMPTSTVTIGSEAILLDMYLPKS